MTDFLVRGTAALAAPHGGDLTQTLAFTTIACANISHLPYGSDAAVRVAEGLDAPGEGLRRPLSVNAVARSLGLPFETVRLRIHRLETLGLCARTIGGVLAPASAASSPAIAGVWTTAYGILCEHLAALVAAGVDLDALARLVEDEPAASEPPPLVAMRIVLDSVLRVLERFATTFGSLSRGYLFCAVATANTRHFDAPPHPPLAFAYAHTPPPDDLRRPVSIRGMARELGLPVETTRRNADRLTSEGWFSLGPGGGLIVPASVYERPPVIEINQTLALNTVRMLNDMRRAGVRLNELGRDTEIGAPAMVAAPPV